MGRFQKGKETKQQQIEQILDFICRIRFLL